MTSRAKKVLIITLAALASCETADIPIREHTRARRTDKDKNDFGVCPPFKLYDEQGNVIDPVAGVNADKPYSPKKTCGRSGCHDYGKITEGFHFTQGKGEEVPAQHISRYAWVTSPGQYGGRW